MDAQPISALLLIMNCVKYEHKAAKQRESWLKGLQIPYYHVLGNLELEANYQFDDQKKILWVKTPDAAVQQSFPAIQYIFKTDDDQMLQSNNPNKFFDNINKMLERRMQTAKIHYAGNIVDVPKAYLSQYYRIHPELPKELPVYVTKYCSGRFYILSMEAIAYLITKRELIFQEYLEDYAMGMHLHNRYKNPMLHLDTDIFFKDMGVDAETETEASTAS